MNNVEIHSLIGSFISGLKQNISAMKDGSADDDKGKHFLAGGAAVICPKIEPECVIEEDQPVASSPVISSAKNAATKPQFRTILPRPKGGVIPRKVAAAKKAAEQVIHVPPMPKPAYNRVYVHQPKLKIKTEEEFCKIEIPTKTLIVICGEGEIGGGAIKDHKCIECLEPLDDYEELKAHYLQEHPWLWSPKIDPEQEEFIYRGNKPRGKLMGWTYRFYCPIPGCSHHMLYREKWKAKKHQQHFPNKYQLTQHYNKVHAVKELKCARCPQMFASANMLKRHEVMCGIKFPCGTCDVWYNDDVSLMTHCRRKKHVYINPLRTPSQVAYHVGDGEQTPGGAVIINVGQMDDVDEVDVKPGQHQLTAAIALSQLSNVEAVLTEDQLPPTNKRLKTSQDLDVIYNQQPKNTKPQDAEELMLSDDGTAAAANQQATGSSGGGGGRKPPKLGEIEQLSTETQTDVELPTKAAAASTGETGSPEDDDDPFSYLFSSNYTQTCTGLGADDDDMMLLPSIDPAEVLQTSDAFGCNQGKPSVGTHTDLGRPLLTGKVMKPSFSNMETQTGTDEAN